MSKEIKPAVGVALLGLLFGLLCIYGGYKSLTGLRGAPDLWGYKRSLALGAPLIAIGGLHLMSAVLQLLLSKAWTAYACIFAALLTTIFYLAFEVSTIGFFGARLVSVLGYGLPIFMVMQGLKAIKADKKPGIPPQQDNLGGES